MIFMFLFKFSESGGADNSRTSKAKQDSANNDNIGLLGVGSGHGMECSHSVRLGTPHREQALQ
jgi:hypothetical protein